MITSQKNSPRIPRTLIPLAAIQIWFHLSSKPNIVGTLHRSPIIGASSFSPQRPTCARHILVFDQAVSKLSPPFSVSIQLRLKDLASRQRLLSANPLHSTRSVLCLAPACLPATRCFELFLSLVLALFVTHTANLLGSFLERLVARTSARCSHDLRALRLTHVRPLRLCAPPSVVDLHTMLLIPRPNLNCNNRRPQIIPR